MPAFCESMPSAPFPLSPALDANSPRSSWNRIFQKMGDQNGSTTSQDLGSTAGIKCHPQTDTNSLDEIFISDSEMFFDPQEKQLFTDLMDLLEISLSEAKDSSLRCSKLLIPDQLIAHIGQELLHLAASEPCGLRGALIDLYIEQGTVCQSVEQIAVDPNLVPTFQLTLVLRLESGLWPRIQDLFTSGPSFTPGFRHALRLSSGFRVIKKKLYSSHELLIEEC
ncbi:DNA damage-inducible transcript 4 protein [Latimeria chalumnae]|uniref:DNA damage-inducible transcript 4 protein n=1 Tax=Latimeria chalumnae TaxID=7897 RepID=H3BDG1_LATCH|nr:PREDICTED: DNA damage-inducible transcript 4 protein [Latimeria chalumnae]|eukprot:XP_005991436.1 PREDICTED: DNA damage-inducible transcript 4 protein [Latimeria chalumnae]